MAAKTAKSVREKAADYYRNNDTTYEEVAKKFKVTRRTIERWASEGLWRGTSQEIKTMVSDKLSEKIADKKATKILSSLDYIDGALIALYDKINTVDPKSLEGAASAIAKLVQVKEELLQRSQGNVQPPELKIVFTTEAYVEPESEKDEV